MNNSKFWSILSNGVMILFSVLSLLPFVLLVIASFTDNQWALANGYSFFPGKWSMDAYRYIATEWDTIGRAYLVSISVTLAGSFISICISSMLAHALSNSRLPGGRILNFLCVFTMLFGGGQVASYYVWSNIFHIRDTAFALVLPNLLMSAFNVILFKNYFTVNIPASLKEAARMDGCGEFRMFWRIIMPMSLPITATVGLMTGLAYWNDWTNGLYYLSQRNGSKYYTVQLLLNQINENIAWIVSNGSTVTVNASEIPSTTIRMAIAVVGVLPVMVIYPFLQKYFVKGITIGAVKE
ncbi:MAG: carbohydrate ABC transporter permease [Roseburia sp.]|jgi:putative aldouronate transport system permease protein|nr:carbohydrate ABC transporter permease [Roseburia sp.]